MTTEAVVCCCMQANMMGMGAGMPGGLPGMGMGAAAAPGMMPGMAMGAAAGFPGMPGMPAVLPGPPSGGGVDPMATPIPTPYLGVNGMITADVLGSDEEYKEVRGCRYTTLWCGCFAGVYC